MSFGVRLESVVRPFVTVESQPIQRIFRRPEPAEPQPATLEWGDGSRFVFPPQVQNPTSGGDDGTTRGPIIDWPDEFGGEDEQVAQWTWTEVSRETSDFRVENPEDPEQFLIVQRIDKMTMADSKSGDTVLLVFRNPGGGDGLLPEELT